MVFWGMESQEKPRQSLGEGYCFTEFCGYFVLESWKPQMLEAARKIKEWGRKGPRHCHPHRWMDEKGLTAQQ
jgi:hypothetical protein